jgi:transcriptional regulator with XRE-family HTH domain
VDRTEFGRLVAALRREQRDEYYREWTQQRLGAETGLGKAVIGKIEQGKRSILDEETLVCLANALNLNSVERSQFYLAAIGIDSVQLVRERRRPAEALDDLMRVLERIRLPASTIDSYGDSVAINLSMMRLIGVSPEALARARSIPAGFNIMRFFFAPESPSGFLGGQWATAASRHVQFFRSITLRQRFSDYFQVCFGQLRHYPLFRQYWQQAALEESRDVPFHGERYAYCHENLGTLDYLHATTTALTAAGELHLVVLIPLDQATTVAFSGLASEGGTTTYRLAPWPEKKFLASAPDREWRDSEGMLPNTSL